MRNKEIETKYKANDISLKNFMAFCDNRKPEAKILASGFDKFYSNKNDDGSFCRHRREQDRFNQLTFKRKTTENNNFIRTEHNISLDLEVSDEQIAALCKEFGYSYKTSLFKNCFIYKYELYTLVYYVCYNEDLEEKGRYIEIEMNEDFKWKNDEEAWSKLVQIEQELKEIGIFPQARMKKSLFEMFK